MSDGHTLPGYSSILHRLLGNCRAKRFSNPVRLTQVPVIAALTRMQPFSLLRLLTTSAGSDAQHQGMHRKPLRQQFDDSDRFYGPIAQALQSA
jgi:hypothetical protein